VRSSTVFAAMLLAIWLLAWGSVTWANVVGGVVVVVALLVALPDVRHRGTPVIVRPGPLIRLVAHYLRDVIAANAQLAREVLRPRPRLRTAIVRVPLAGCTPEVLTAVANLVAMTPGQMPVEVEDDPPVVYVHVLQFTSAVAVRREIWGLRDELLAAFGTREAIAAAAAERATLDPPSGAAP